MNRQINLDAPVTLGRQRAVTLAVAALVFGVLANTSDRLPMAWDEGDALHRSELVYDWCVPPEPAKLSAEQIRRAWRFTTVGEGHPALLGWVDAISGAIAEHYFSPLTAYRAGTMLLFAIALASAFFRLWNDYTFSVALTAVVAALIMPRLFAHAHFALFDSLVTSGWLLAWATFQPALKHWFYRPLWGLALGLTLSAKFTGWLAPIPFVLWMVIYRDRRAMKTLAIGLPLAVVTFWALNPPLWHDPLLGFQKFFDLNLHRADRPEHNISTQFAGRMYNLDYPLPWYNTLVWTAITILPVPLLLGVTGIVKSLRRWRSDPMAVLLVLNWATLIVVRALPWAPPHDAERLILPSFAFFALLIAVGTGRLLYRESLTLPDKICAQRWVFVVLAIALLNGVGTMFRFAPQWLSYYSPLVGGLRGAVALGFEPTYYWDSFDDEVVTWLNNNTEPNEKVVFSHFSRSNRAWLFWWDKFRFQQRFPYTNRWYVLQRRPSASDDVDDWLLANATPAFEKQLHGTPLLEVYDYADYLRALAATGAKPSVDAPLEDEAPEGMTPEEMVPADEQAENKEPMSAKPEPSAVEPEVTEPDQK
jgi:4-amino-4-deoxy-L-arabinose transferase-like glycosyltransferase